MTPDELASLTLEHLRHIRAMQDERLSAIERRLDSIDAEH